MRTRRVVVAFVVALGAVVAASGPVSAQAGVPAEDIAVRDQLIADQENLLNTYRCLFGTDTDLVPGGCPTPDGVAPSAAPASPTQQDIELRDGLIRDQEALLNVYRCQFDVDTELVPEECQSDNADTTTPTPANLGPIPPLAEPSAVGDRIAELIQDCGFWTGRWYRQCQYANGRFNFVDQIKIARIASELYGCDSGYEVGRCSRRTNPGADIWEKRIELAEYQEACGYGRRRFGFNYYECSHDPLDHSAPARPEHNAEVVRLGREAYDCDFQVLVDNHSFCASGFPWVGGATMRQISDETFCNNGWLYHADATGPDILYNCYHPEHPDVAHRHRR